MKTKSVKRNREKKSGKKDVVMERMKKIETAERPVEDAGQSSKRKSGKSKFPSFLPAGGICLLAGILCFILYYVLPVYNSYGITRAYFDSVNHIARAEDGRYAVIDSYRLLYLLVPEQDDSCRIAAMTAAGAQEVFYQAAFDRDGNLYLLKQDGQQLVLSLYDSAGNHVRDVMSRSLPQGKENSFLVSALSASGDSISFLQTVYEEDTEYIVCNPVSGQVSITNLPAAENKAVIMDAATNGRGDYLFLYSDNSVRLQRQKEAAQTVFASAYDFYENPDAPIVIYATFYRDGMVYTDGHQFYYDDLDGSGKEQLLFRDADICAEEMLQQYAEEDLYTTYLGSDGDTLFITILDSVYFVNGQTVTELVSAAGLPFAVQVADFINAYGLAAGCFLCVAALILFLLFAGSRWRMTLLWKQLLVTVPLVLLMAAVMAAGFVRQYRESYKNSVADALMEYNEIFRLSLDGDALRQMSDFTISTDGRLSELRRQIMDALSAGKSEWSRDISCSIYLADNAINGRLLVSTDTFASLFTGEMYIADTMEELSASGAQRNICKTSDTTVVMATYLNEDEYLTAITPVYDSQGNITALLISEMSYAIYSENLTAILTDLIRKVILFVALLVAVLCVLTYLSTRRLKMAGQAIHEIAAGNFDARISGAGSDEVGAICEGVNEMAKQLENHFDLLDRNEKFYYKFVPEKFKELLHKKEFTDLCLGDAESADLTVLFCDIRSFSLNSEMMTARENFEFVNVIYGKAGPVIRRHNGFVDKYIGDAVMALFESADDAVAAGMELYREIVQNPETAQQLHAEQINIGIGIHSGLARIGIVGEKERLSGTVISNTVNISSRLESLTKQYQTAMLLTKETLDRLKDPDALHTRYLGMVQVAGVNEVKGIYEVLDCLEDTRREPRQANAHIFREAVRLFHMGQPEDALRLMQTLDLDNPADPVPAKYYHYIREEIAAGGKRSTVFRFSRK